MSAVEMMVWAEKVVIRPDPVNRMQVHGIDLYPSALPSRSGQKVQLNLGINDDVPAPERMKMADGFRALADAIDPRT